MNAICAHLMTHKEKLLPCLLELPEKYSTVYQEGAVEESKLYCCFGCKKAFKNRKSAREHIQLEDHSQKNHDLFLKDIGFNVEKVKQQRLTDNDNKTIREQAQRIQELEQQLKERDEGNIYSHRLSVVESELIKAQSHIRRLEEGVRVAPLFMKDNYRQFCQEFVTRWNLLKQNSAQLPGPALIEKRRELLRILETTPLLQLYLLPSYTFLLNQHYMNGEYQSLTGHYFSSHFDYMPSESIHGDPYTLPSYPTWNLEQEVRKHMEVTCPDYVEAQDEIQDQANRLLEQYRQANEKSSFASQNVTPIPYSKTNKRPAKMV